VSVSPSSAVACPECGSPVYAADRFCGACGLPVAVNLSSSHAAKLLAELRALSAGEYEVRGEIGRGGMAIVYLAYDLRLNRKVAIKAMLPDLAFHAGMEERFKREARTAARLDHPNIVVIYSGRDSGDPLFFVMKYVDGAPLDSVIRRHGALPIPVVQGILLQLCAALQYAHSDGVIHRDVKPANILVDSRGNVQVTDFGIAKAIDSGQLTQTGMAIGTPSYMCPEQCIGQPQSAASDQYSVGVVAYELLTGHPPFTGSAVEIQWSHLKDEPPPITSIRPDCPPTLNAAVMRMLAKSPSERWPALRDAIPLIATGNPVDTEAGRLALAELVRTSPATRAAYSITPLSPVPQHGSPRASPTVPVAAPAQITPSAPVTPLAPVTPPALVSIEIAPRQCSVEVGTTERLRARVRDAQGREASDTPEWSSSNPAIASVDDAGVVTAHAIGTVTIAAMMGSLASMANVEVIPATIARVDVEPSIVSVEQGESVRLTVRAYSAKAKQIFNSPVTFRSADATVAEFDASGSVTGVAAGRTTAVVSVGGVEARLIITVNPTRTTQFAALESPPQRFPVRALVAVGVLGAVALAAWGIARKPNAVQPLASTASAGALDTTPPVAPAVAAATPKLTATPAVRGPVPADTVVAALELTDPSPMAIEVGETKMLVAKVTNQRGELIPTTRVDWEVSAPAVATVDSDGVLIAVAPGRSLVTAKVGDRTRVLAVDVQASSVGRVPASIVRDSLQPGESAPNESEAQAIVDSVVVMVERQTVRMSQLARTAGDVGAQFQKFIETNNPTAKLGGPPVVSGAKVAVGVVLQWEKPDAQTRRERTVNVELAIEPVKGGWAIRELRFPNGFTP
jgi:serine/threonine-protein kinase